MWSSPIVGTSIVGREENWSVLAITRSRVSSFWNSRCNQSPSNLYRNPDWKEIEGMHSKIGYPQKMISSRKEYSPNNVYWRINQRMRLIGAYNLPCQNGIVPRKSIILQVEYTRVQISSENLLWNGDVEDKDYSHKGNVSEERIFSRNINREGGILWESSVFVTRFVIY